MARPEVSATAEEMYAALGPWTRDDEANDWALLKFVDTFASQLQVIEDIVRDTDESDGWGRLLSGDLVPDWAIEWLAQFVGVDIPQGLTAEQRRVVLQETPGWSRGTVAAIEGAARVWLTGSKTVEVYERVNGSAYQVQVRTYLGETIDPVKLEAAVRAQKPAGLILTYTPSGLTWDDVDPATTWDDVDPTLTWEQVALMMPGDV